MPEHAPGDAADEVVELPGVDLGRVGESIAVGVLDEVDAFAQGGEVAHVVDPVAGEILDPLRVEGAVFGRELLAVESLLLLGRGEAEIIRDPVGVVADVEVVGLAAHRLGDIGAALGIEADRDGVGHLESGRPLRVGESLRIGMAP